MDIEQFFPEKYLKGDDFAGRDVTMTVRTVVVEELHNPKTQKGEDKVLMYFEEIHAKAEREGRVKDQKRIVLSKTLKVDFVGMFGKETKDWHGKRVTFYRGPAIAGGKQVIRARSAPVSTEPQTATDGAS